MGVAPSDLAVIVTGGARGLGRAMALGLAKAGVRVAVADLPSSPRPCASSSISPARNG